MQRQAEAQPLLALVLNDEREGVFTYSEDGSYLSSGLEHGLDLINPAPKPVKLERWVNVYRRSDGELITGSLYPFLQEAASRAFFDPRLAVVAVGIPVLIEFTPEE